MKFKLLNIIAIFFIIILNGCTKETIDLNKNGNITGLLNVYDEIGEIINPVQNFEVQIIDTSLNMLYSAIPDVDGRFSFENLPFGEYLINSKSEGYSGYPNAFITAGGPETRILQLSAYEIPSNSITIDSIQFIVESDFNYLRDVIMHFRFNEPINHIGSTTGVFVFLADSPDSTGYFDFNTGISNNQYYINIAEGPQQCRLSQIIYQYNLTNMYLQAYICNPASYSQRSSVKYLNMNPVMGTGSNVVEFNRPIIE